MTALPNLTSRIKVPIQRNPYEVVIRNQGLKSAGEELIATGIKKGTKCLIVSNPEVAEKYAQTLISSLIESGFDSTILVLEAGEEQKTLEGISQIHDAAVDAKIERGSIMIALGGGVVGDMTGFAAATWLRGISFVQVPTTLLAMVDASVGGKTGVNHSRGKNLIGAFHQPKIVLIDPYTLKSLPDREFRAGMAEVIKYGVIGDKRLFEILENISSLDSLNNLNDNQLKEIIERSVTAKANIVAKDELESGIRAILNYGHTFGHVIENLCGYGNYLHGEAVAIGMLAIGELALIKKNWKKEDAIRQYNLIKKVKLPTRWPDLDLDKVLPVLMGDKKVKDGNLRFIMPKTIGNVEIRDDISKTDIEKFLSRINF